MKEDTALDITLRPKYLKDYIGQEKVKEQISLFIEASKKKSEVLDHVLINGPPGLGKTTLAQVIANELKKNIVFTSGPLLEKKGDLAGILSQLEEGDILFIDEIHRLNPSVEETLYPAIEDFRIDIIIGKGSSSRTVRIELPRFTLIGATTRAGMLTSPLLSRFGIVLNMDFYDITSLKSVILRSAKILSIEITEEGAFEIAKRSRGTPRTANRLLKRVHDYSVVHYSGKIDKKIAQEALEFFEIDENGLDQNDKRYLFTLVKRFGGKPVGLSTLSSALSESKSTIEELIEPYLLREGYIERTPKGRIPTEKAIKLF
ncbi:Holliday junction DNA helicase subunit RuvB [Persephonella hydrogeniphila]|uniref:Holliday junction branch migration complex subunit RuvB n=1 Tax=Persephonella hydrogeniphila TaxID=198703 RepID=A0A285NMF0_9AQUI|nr:Holliday junction branch migration DNA helicase RuvB [Persephonella hydrogeniphila]SNZ10103.1 Holliday junction DNA helicase subunit RuvB [Persephonella hydrogeniphila]